MSLRSSSRGTNQKLLLESQIDQIGVRHLEELEMIRTELEEKAGTGDLALKDWLVEQLSRIETNIETDILDFSQEFENNKLKKLLSLLKAFKVTNRKLTGFDIGKFGQNNFQEVALKKIDQIVDILDGISDQVYPM